jgi:iron-sulfur cluster assembly protein
MSNSSSPAQQQLVEMTNKAIEEVQRLLQAEPEKQGMGLRLGVMGGGCSGFSYKFEFDHEKELDNTIPFEGFQVYLDPKSSIYLKGLTVDYQDGLEGKGFRFINPNATNTCGCGESFSI